MSGVQVNVEEPETTPEETSRDAVVGEEAAAETLIDAGIVAGIAAERADERANEASISEVAAEINAARSEQAAAVVIEQNNDLRNIADTLLETSRNLAAVQAAQTAQEVTELPEPGLDPTIDIEPSNDHWLTKKWSFGGMFGNKKTEVD